MILFTVQTALSIVAGVALYRLWRAFLPPQRTVQLIAAIGFLARAVLGQAFFWISWAKLPIGRSLQLGDGFWVFAEDARWYFPEAAQAAQHGLRGIVFFDRSHPGVSYVQVLAGAVALLGSAVAVSVLLNLFFYVASIALLVHWSRSEPRAETPAAVAIAAVAISPAFVLWSLQPLKDSFFQFLFIAFVATCAAWQRAWLTRGRWLARIGTAVVLAVLIFAVAGMRWYFAALLIGATAFFMLLVAIRAAAPKIVAFASALVVLVALAECFLISAATYIPGPVKAIVKSQTALGAAKTAPASVLSLVERTRAGFDITPANTAIRVGDTLKVNHAKPEKVEPLPPPLKASSSPSTPAPETSTPKPEPAVAEAAPAAPAPQQPQLQPMTAAAEPQPVAVQPAAPEETPVAEPVAAQVRAFLTAHLEAWNRGDVEGVMAGYWNSPDLAFTFGATERTGWQSTYNYIRESMRTYRPLSFSDIGVYLRPDGLIAADGTWHVNANSGSFRYRLQRSGDAWKIVWARVIESAPPTPQPVAAAAPPVVAPKPAAVVAKKHAAAPKHVASAAPAPPPPPPPFNAVDAQQIREFAEEQVTAWNHNDLPRFMETFAKSPDLKCELPGTVVRGWPQTFNYYRTNIAGSGSLGWTAYTDLHVDPVASGLGSLRGRWQWIDARGNARHGVFRMLVQRFPNGWRAVKTSFRQTDNDDPAMQTRMERLLSGAAALVLPRSVGEWLGLFKIGGGHGMLWFTEIDTVVFDLVLAAAMIALVLAVRSRLAWWRNPLTWLVLLITVLITAPLIYTISNFGSLFRLREMIYVGLLLTPLALVSVATPSRTSVVP